MAIGDCAGRRVGVDELRLLARGSRVVPARPTFARSACRSRQPDAVYDIERRVTERVLGELIVAALVQSRTVEAGLTPFYR